MLYRVKVTTIPAAHVWVVEAGSRAEAQCSALAATAERCDLEFPFKYSVGVEEIDGELLPPEFTGGTVIEV